MPRSRPRGKRAWLWVLHLGFIIASTFGALTMFWLIIPGVWRWVVLGIYVYSAVITPFALRNMLSTYWNAPEAAEKNRELAVGRR